MVSKPVAKLRRARGSASAVRKPARSLAAKPGLKQSRKAVPKRKVGAKPSAKAGAAILRGLPSARSRASSPRYDSHLRMTDKKKKRSLDPVSSKPKPKPKPKPKQAPKLKPKPKKGGSVPAIMTYSAELLANGQRRFEQTDEAISAIAADFGIQPFSMRRLAQRLGWVRFGLVPKQLPVTARLLEQAEQLAAAHADAPASVNIVTIARIEVQVLKELADLEAARAQLRGVPQPMREAEHAARTLTSLTDTLQKLQRMRLPLMAADQRPGMANDLNDELPGTIDEIRYELARRIDAFIASRFDAGDAEDTADVVHDGAA